MDDPTTSGASALSEEPSRGLAAALRLAAAKGYLDKNTSKTEIPVAAGNIKKVKLDVKAHAIEEKYDKRVKGYEKRSRGNKLNEIDESDYKPDIHLTYTDDSGRKLDTPKESFRYLCHKFHGKGPGKNKIDKRLKQQQNKIVSTDTPNSAILMLSKQKELKQPFIVLSKGK